MVDVSRNGVVLVTGARAVSFFPIVMPSSKMPNQNFIILTDGGELIDYNKFGVSQFLYYIIPSDLGVFSREYLLKLVEEEEPPET